MKKSKSVLGFWVLVGLALGVSFGMLFGSFTIGLPMGFYASFLVAIIVDRSYRGLSRLTK